MISTVMKLHFTRESLLKQNTVEITVNLILIYSFLKHLANQIQLFNSIKTNEDWEELYKFSQLHRIFLNLFNIQAPQEKKLVRGKNRPSMIKTSRKAIVI